MLQIFDEIIEYYSPSYSKYFAKCRYNIFFKHILSNEERRVPTILLLFLTLTNVYDTENGITFP